MASKIIAFPPSAVDQLSQDNFLGSVVDTQKGEPDTIPHLDTLAALSYVAGAPLPTYPVSYTHLEK